MSFKKYFSLFLVISLVLSQSFLSIALTKNNDSNENNTNQHTGAAVAVNSSDPVHIPDTALKEHINKTLGGGRPANQAVTKADMERIDVINIHTKTAHVSDLTGLEYAVNLENLAIDRNDTTVPTSPLKGLDVLKSLTKLIKIQLSNYDIKSIDLSNNVMLREITLNNDNISQIDLSKNTELTFLALHDNKISELDLSNNVKLNVLYAISNNISSIDLSKNLELEYLSFDKNKLTSLDLSKTKVKLTHDTFSAATQIVDINPDEVISDGTTVTIKRDFSLNGQPIPNFYSNDAIEFSYDANNTTLTIKNVQKPQITFNFYDTTRLFWGEVTLNIAATGVSLNTTNSTITTGNTQQLTATISPKGALDKKVTWTSSDEKVATVDQNGLVTAVAPGTAQINVTANDGGHVASTEIIVKDADVVEVKITPANAQMNIGDKQQLSVTVTSNSSANKTVLWSSSDEKVATVDQNGVVTAVGAGTATITATVNVDGTTTRNAAGYIGTSTITVLGSANSEQNINTNTANNPKTGDIGLSSILGLGFLGLCSAFVSKKRKNK